MATRILAAAALSAALVLGGCQNPDGSTNWGNTLLLGAGIGTAAALLAGASSDHGRPRHYAGGYGGGYGGGHGGWQPGYGRPTYGYGAGGYRNW